jgi:hypothetical protein
MRFKIILRKEIKLKGSVMKKFVVCLALLLLTGFLFALDTAGVERLALQAGRKAGYNLAVTSRSRTWDEQVDEMVRLSDSSARQMYGYADDLWNAYTGYKSGKVTKQSLISTMQKYRSRFKHVGGNAIDIGINRSGLDTQEKINAVKSALTAAGLSVYDESDMGNPCLHVYQ